MPIQNPPDLTGSPYAKPVVPYIWPFLTKNLDPNSKPPGQVSRIDQGWDLQNTAPDWRDPGEVFAIAAGTVSIQGSGTSGFGPSYPVVKLTTPSIYGDSVYYGHIIATVPAGTPVKQGDVIGTTKYGGQGNAKSLDGWLEIGWWKDGKGPVAPLDPNNTGKDTLAGHQMHDTLIGAPTRSGANVTTPPGTGGTTGGTPAPGTPDPNATQQWQYQLPDEYSTVDLDDPRDNLPFSAFFLGQHIVGGPVDKMSPTAGRGGSLSVHFQGGQGPSMPGVTLKRGAIAESQPFQKMRPRGPFVCYFMMNPNSVSISMQVDTNGIASPFTQSQDLTSSGAQYPLQNQSVSFTLMFNRMYEVWHGNMVGPSELGVRWDVRALERLMGIYDAKQNPTSKYAGSEVGEGTYGEGNYPPQSLPIQVIFGGKDSIRFQGIIVTMDVHYTRFSMDMIPVEASVDIGIMKLYQPSFVGANLLNIMDRGNYLQIGKPVTNLRPGATFNTYTGLPPIKK